MYKFRYSNLSTIILIFIMILCLALLALTYIGCSKDGYSNVEMIALSILNILLGGLAIATLFMIGNYAGVIITLNSHGIEKRLLFRKRIFIEWKNIIKIENGSVPDYITGFRAGYIFLFYRNNKISKIIFIKNKKIINAMERIVPKNLLIIL